VVVEEGDSGGIMIWAHREMRSGVCRAKNVKTRKHS
jgi:hypothetical protein